MPYCRKCGAKLDDDARFCRVCGTPVESYQAAPAQPQPTRYRRRHGPLPIIAGVLIAILVLALLFAALSFIPAQSVNFGSSYQTPASAGVNTVALTFNADVADINIVPTNLPDQLVRLDVNASGSAGIFGDATKPVNVSYMGQTSGNTANVNVKIARTEAWPFSFNLRVTCNLYVDPSAILDFNVKTTVGSININPGVPTTFRGLILKSTTGSIDATFSNLVTLPSNVSLSTTTGSVRFNWVNAQVNGDAIMSLLTTTGSVNLNIAEHQNQGQHQSQMGTVQVDAKTTTGSVNPTINIDGNVGAQITSHTSFGSISTTLQSFNGNKSLLYSSNYPAAHNFVINCDTTTGSININAVYGGGSETATEQTQVRDAVMSYIQMNHPQTASLMQDLSWTGGRATPEGIVGYETYVYTTVPSGIVGAAGWTVTLGYPVVPNPIYQITANFTQAGVQDPYNAVWEGSWQNGNITETNYSFIHYFDATPTP